MNEQEQILAQLHASLSARVPPENLTTKMRKLNGQIAYALRGAGSGHDSWMSERFDPPASLAKQCSILSELLGLDDDITEEDGRSVHTVDQYVRMGLVTIAKAPAARSFREDRLNREQRKDRGLDMSKRQYNKLFRAVVRLQQASEELENQTQLFRLTRFAKTGYAADITWDDFKRCKYAAAFVAYYTANKARRSQFTNGPQARAFDEPAKRLFELATAQAEPNLWPIALVYPDERVLRALTEPQRMQLLDLTMSVMERTAKRLKAIGEQKGVDISKMIVRRGADSSTWNALAGAWNHARNYWLAITDAMDAQNTYDAFLPGKVMRLMAADVARWHEVSGGGLDPDTKVWALLPKPWDVMDGTKHCGRKDVIRALAQAGRRTHKPINESSWLGPRPTGHAVPWQPTPDLVHGVTVNSPRLAAFMRRVGVFSGKKISTYMTARERERIETGWEKYVVRY